MSERRDVELDDDVVMETDVVMSKQNSSAQLSDDRVEEDARDDGSSYGQRRGDDNEREGSPMKVTKPSPSRKPRGRTSSQGRRSIQDGHQAQGGRGGSYPRHGAHRNPPNGPPYPHPPYGYAPGPAGAPHDPYRGVPPPPPHPHYHQAPHVPYAAPGPFHPGSAYHPMSGHHPGGPAYRVPQYPPSSHPYSGYHGGHNQGAYPTPSDCSSSASSKSKGSKNSKGPSKKRTISGVHGESSGAQEMISYPFRRTGSNASTSSTVTAGNNTSTETPYLADDSPHQRVRSKGSELPSTMSSANLFEDADQLNQMNQHRRTNSTASTASSLSVGGFSLSSYDKPRGHAGDDRNYEDSSLIKASPKKRKSSGRSLPTIDTSNLHRRVTSNSSQSVDVAGAPSRFQKLSMEDSSSKPPSGAAEAHRRENSSRNLFLTMSTSPINSDDIEATPSIKNTKKSNNMSDSTNSFDRGGDTPTPTEAMAERDMVTNEHMLNQHLRSQSFTPLSHLANGSENGRESISNSPAMNSQGFSGIAPQLSWSIAGDAPSLADLADWEEDIHNQKPHSDHKRDNNSVVSKGSTGARGMTTSPTSFGMWKEEEGSGGIHHKQREGTLSPSSDVAMNEDGGNAESTPLPMFYGHPVSSEERENVMKAHPRYVSSSDRASRMSYPESGNRGAIQPQFGDAEHIHHLFLTNGGRSNSSSKPFRNSSHHLRLPPTPVYGEHHDEGFGRSPLNGDGHPEFFSTNIFGHGMHNDRVRNLRGRGMPGHHMQLQLPAQTLSHHHNLTSPIGIGSNGKPGMWGMAPTHSPHHLPHLDMNASKRKCMPLKPPIPSKFQGDIEKMKTAKVPEFANLVNFPNHMSQKQSVNLPDGMRCCVMCGQACPCSASNKNKKNGDKKGKDGGLAPRNSNGQDAAKEKQSNGYAIIPTQNKGLCTLCDVNVWVVTQNGLEIKWCKGCKNFRPWAAFGDKGLATKCLRCRERQREKYALQKEEKERQRNLAKGLKNSKMVKATI